MCYKCFRFYFYIFLVTLPVGYGGTPIYDLYITFRGWVSRLDSPRVKICNFLRGHFRTFRCSILDGKAIHFIQVCVKMYLFKKTNLLTKQNNKKYHKQDHNKNWLQRKTQSLPTSRTVYLIRGVPPWTIYIFGLMLLTFLTLKKFLILLSLFGLIKISFLANIKF